ncbi:MAG: type II toxin-antitoxin system RelE/ParE family toxin [Myxococcaceae bacterium]
MKSLRFEQLKGDRAGQCSMRLNDQFRLIGVVEKKNGEELLIIEIVDYH